MSPVKPINPGRMTRLLVVAALAIAACKGGDTRSSVSAFGNGGASSYSDLTVSFYDVNAFGGGCAAPAGVPQANGIAVAEGVFGLTCSPNWVKVDNPDSPQDVEDSDITDAKDKEEVKRLGVTITNKRSYLDAALKACGGRCVKLEGGIYKINLPSCNMPGLSNACDGKTYTLSTNQAKGSASVYMHSVCPANHWKNLAKLAFGVDNNHCSHPHVDISTGMIGQLGLSKDVQNQLRVTLSLGGSSDATKQASTTSGGPTLGSAEERSASGDGYANCTNGSDNGNGWGWDEAVTDPQGSHSCRVPSASAGATPAPSATPAMAGGFTCEEQAGWGKCSEDWMHPVCDHVCGSGGGSGGAAEAPPAAAAPSDGASVGGFTCEEQAGWGKCSEAWMTPVCDYVCK